MSPRIWRDGDLVADVVDETGMHEMLDGSPLYVNVDGIGAYNDWQPIIVEAKQLGGRRTVGLTQEGKGRSSDPKRGDGMEPEVHVLLNDRPIRISYRDQVWVERTATLASPRPGGYYIESKRTYHNPRWIRGRERE